MNESHTPALQQMAKDWYHLLDVHAPMLELMPMLATEGLEMVFPEATLRGQNDFVNWYQGVIRIFFDEVHQVVQADVRYEGDEAHMDIVVHWEASVWKPPARNSERISLEAFQRWVVVLENDKPVVKTYIVDRLEYNEGSAKL
jgi:hypothetical protein